MFAFNFPHYKSNQIFDKKKPSDLEGSKARDFWGIKG